MTSWKRAGHIIDWLFYFGLGVYSFYIGGSWWIMGLVAFWISGNHFTHAFDRNVRS